MNRKGIIIAILFTVALIMPSCQGQQNSGMMIGVHVQNCDYSFTNDNLLEEGSERILELGSQAIGIYMGPEYKGYYPGIKSRANNLVELAQFPEFKELFQKPFTVYSITAYAFAGGLHYKWREGIESYDCEREYSDIRDLAEYLLKEFNNSGKIFILKNWEGDWHLQSNYRSNEDPKPESSEAMIRWLRARTKAVEDARNNITNVENVKVYSAVEFNLVLKVKYGGRAALTDVIPHVSADLYSYSAWEALRDPGQIKVILDIIKSYAPDSEAFGSKNVMIGEFGCPDKFRDKLLRLRIFIDSFEAWGIPFSFLWQLYDNECNGKALYPEGADRRRQLECKGYSLIDKFGNPKAEWYLLKDYLQD